MNKLFTQIYTQYWLDLPKEIRNHLVTIFDIPRSGITEIRDDKVIADGHTNEDLKAITEERMKAYTGVEGSFPILWEATVLRAFNDIAITIVAKESEQAEIAARYCLTCTAKSGRHKKGCPKYK